MSHLTEYAILSVSPRILWSGIVAPVAMSSNNLCFKFTYTSKTFYRHLLV